ncbi:MAG: TlpA family protein disulfide reductase, partial [Thermoleophilia bacterium]|nr:TlpA family protein disulfide reductase [Thermoleophilia bacterium]
MPRTVTLAPAVVALCLAAAGCGSQTDQTPPRPVAVEQFKPDLARADPRLKRIYVQASTLLTGGRGAYDKRIAELRGLPIVVNKWGSWCGPCRAEFPLFQQAAKANGGKIAFLGVNVSDGRGAAREFLRARPLPYPSYVDDRLLISQLLPPVAGAPSTGFYDATGK